MRLLFSRASATGCIAAAAAAAVGAGGFALAGGGTSGTTIHACVGISTGVPRIASRCRPGERPLSWNQIGPPGPAGDRGVRGASGSPDR
jgi:hypothetical protein